MLLIRAVFGILQEVHTGVWRIVIRCFIGSQGRSHEGVDAHELVHNMIVCMDQSVLHVGMKSLGRFVNHIPIRQLAANHE